MNVGGKEQSGGHIAGKKLVPLNLLMDLCMQGEKSNLVAILLAKNLLGIGFERALPLRTVLEVSGGVSLSLSFSLFLSLSLSLPPSLSVSFSLFALSLKPLEVFSLCTILYYTILYYILYYTILYYTVLYHTILYYTILYYTYCTIPYRTVPSILYHTIL